ncbi:hypothetical protein [Micromonospora sp. NPDC093277]|uniref:hypothetical protein n=1 Tax=Micromonospora sp. NPDC093277 TaxID=3364291 RepID=UPI003826904F
MNGLAATVTFRYQRASIDRVAYLLRPRRVSCRRHQCWNLEGGDVDGRTVDSAINRWKLVSRYTVDGEASMRREFRVFSSIVGRRTALKYVGLGALAAVASACSRTGPSGNADRTGQAEKSGGGKKPTVAARTLEAFAKGTWAIAVSDPKQNGTSPTGTLTLGDGKWTISPGILSIELAAHGDYTLSGASVSIVRRYNDEERKQYPDVVDETYTGGDLPAQVGRDAQTYQVSWSFGAKHQICSVYWNGDAFLINANDGYGKDLMITLTRQA